MTADLFYNAGAPTEEHKLDPKLVEAFKKNEEFAEEVRLMFINMYENLILANGFELPDTRLTYTVVKDGDVINFIVPAPTELPPVEEDIPDGDE